MELFIETLTGSSMMLHVSPLDTVHDVKTYIEKLEGMFVIVAFGLTGVGLSSAVIA